MKREWLLLPLVKVSQIIINCCLNSVLRSVQKTQQSCLKTTTRQRRGELCAALNSAAVCLQYRYLCRHACQVASVVFDSLQPYGPQPARLLSPRDSPGKNTGMGCHDLFQRIFLTQRSNPHLLCLLHQQAGSLPLVPYLILSSLSLDYNLCN